MATNSFGDNLPLILSGAHNTGIEPMHRITPKNSRLFSLPVLSILAWLSIWSNHAVAQGAITPENIPGTTKVTAEGVIELFENKPDIILIDSRIRGDRERGYIESSISLPNTETNCDTLAEILPTKSTPVLFYCNGVKCGRSAKAINIALQCGYQQIYWFRGGFEVWLEKGFPFLKE